MIITRSLRSFSCACVLFAFPFLLVSCMGVRNNSKAKLVAGAASGSLNSPNTLAMALPVINDGEANAEDVRVSSISITGGKLIDPATLPKSLGIILKNRLGFLGATFTAIPGTGFQPGGTYTLKVAGTFREGGNSFEFALAQSLQLPPAPGSAHSLSSSSPAQIGGGPFPPQTPAFDKEVNRGGNGWTVPDGPDRPAQSPSHQTAIQPAVLNDPPVDIETNTSIGFPQNRGPNEPSGAVSGGGIVFETFNWSAAYSKDGVHFKGLDPTTMFRNDFDGGFCCDQQVQYVPSIERFIWVMQFHTDAAGNNRYRIAAANPTSDLSSGKSWTYWDITSAQVGGGVTNAKAGGGFDYPDTSVGNNSLYVSGDLSTKSVAGREVIRIPLAEIKSGSTINFRYINANDAASAWGDRMAQNALDEIFWAGQINNSTLRIFSWQESSIDYSWSDVPIEKWPSLPSRYPKNYLSAGIPGMISTTPPPDPQNWLAYLPDIPGNSIQGATRLISGPSRQQNELLFAWTASSGMGFPQPHVQWVALDVNKNFKFISQQQVWNANNAFAFAAFAVNSDNEIGMSLQSGGGGTYENHCVGFWGDFVLYTTTASNVGVSDIGHNHFGDFVTIRPYTPDPKRFAAFGYGMEKATGTDTHYVVFGRPGK